MDPQHRELARIGLAVVGRFGFVLAGGYALEAHGLINRVSEDVDLFTNHLDSAEFSRAVDAITVAYEQGGHPVEIVRRAELFARLHVGRGEQVRVELAYDWRAANPALLEIGPVLDRDDAVASKVLALWGRAEVRDYIDVYAALTVGQYAESDLLRLAGQADAGFELTSFGRVLLAVVDVPDDEFSEYGVTASSARSLRDCFQAWGQVLSTTGPS